MRSGNIRKRAVLLAAILLCSMTAFADLMVVPGGYATVGGNSLSSTLLQTDGRNYQMQIAASLLSGIPVGSTLTGVSWRLFSTLPSFPTVPITWSDYEITLAQAAHSISSFSPTLAGNMTSPQLVRDGALILPAGSFPGGSTPNAWGQLIAFNTPYTYQGGDLVMLISLGPSNGDSSYLDSIGAGSASYGVLYTARTQYPGDTNTYNADFTITQFQYSSEAIPEPATLTLGGIGLLAIFALSRRRKG